MFIDQSGVPAPFPMDFLGGIQAGHPGSPDTPVRSDSRSHPGKDAGALEAAYLQVHWGRPTSALKGLHARRHHAAHMVRVGPQRCPQASSERPENPMHMDRKKKHGVCFLPFWAMSGMSSAGHIIYHDSPRTAYSSTFI